MAKTIWYLGPAGTFSECAAQQAARDLKATLGEARLLPCGTIEAVCERCCADPDPEQFGIGVLPYYNLLEGLVQETIDGIATHDLWIFHLVRIPIVFCLGMPPGVGPDQITEVVSHPKALAQCSEFLHRQFPQAQLRSVASTAEGVRIASQSPRQAVIASRRAIESSSLTVWSENVGNPGQSRTNFTDFFCILPEDRVRECRALFPSTDRSIIALTPPVDVPGTLASALAVFADLGINLAKLHSRPALQPAPQGRCPQTFFLEAELGAEDPRLNTCLDLIRAAFRSGAGAGLPDRSRWVRLLGGFPQR